MMLHFFAESAVLAAVAAVLGLAAGAAAVRALVSGGPAGIPRLAEVRIDAWTVLFTVAVAATLAIACSALPALAVRLGGRDGLAFRVNARRPGGRAERPAPEGRCTPPRRTRRRRS